MARKYKKKEKPVSLAQANLRGRQYKSGKIRDCRYCYFWGGKNKGCKRDECWYLVAVDAGSGKRGKMQKKIEERAVDKDGAARQSCLTCPYGRVRPCIGYCIDKIMKEITGR